MNDEQRQEDQRIERLVQALFASGAKHGRSQGGSGLAGMPVPSSPLPQHGGTHAAFPAPQEDVTERF